ncbi:MAG: ABC-2 transporter permease [Blautia sp.]|nr:ABC-2 transporter permease [Blautia sp.]MDY5032388.1 ABC-2 transporter permease [Blautia sp.]
MKSILKKELTLSASILSYLFILFGFMFFIPGYPILCGVFFVTLGIFQSFQNAREANDIVFSALLPVAKKDVVKGKYLFSCFIELCSILLMVIAALIRMTVLEDVVVYRNNAMMNANFFALGIALFLFGLFNLIFIGGFFKTAYKFGKPFVTHIIVTFVMIGIGEALHHIPGLEAVNAFGFAHFGLQFGLLALGAMAYIVLTVISYRCACRNFERIDL